MFRSRSTLFEHDIHYGPLLSLRTVTSTLETPYEDACAAYYASCVGKGKVKIRS